jgi:hypothetical protein
MDPKYSDGIYFTDPASGASAIVLKQGSDYIVAFRGTDGQNDTEPLSRTSDRQLHSSLRSLAQSLERDCPIWWRLFIYRREPRAGGATNLMAGIAGFCSFGGAFAAATFVAFCLA